MGLKVPNDLDQLRTIPDTFGDEYAHHFARCWGDHGEGDCCEPVKYCMTIEEWPFDEGYYNTAYWCEKHKPTY